MQSPRIGLVFWLRQCDKENHGWCEGPPLTVVLAREFRSVEGLHPPEYSTRTKKEYCRLTVIRKLMHFGIGRYTAVFRHNPFRRAEEFQFMSDQNRKFLSR